MTAVSRIFCSRTTGAHQIATITADADGLLLSYREAVATHPSDPHAVQSPQDGFYYRKAGAKRQMRAPRGEVLEVEMWCTGCRTGHPVDVGGLFAAARRGERKIRLTSRGSADGAWKAL